MSGRRRWQPALLAVLALVAAGTVLVWWGREEPRAQGPRAGWTPAVVLVAGDGKDGARDGLAFRARFSEPFDVALAPDGRLYVVDAGSANRIRSISAGGRVTTTAGGVEGFADGSGVAARFATPSGIALLPDGTLVVADTGNHAIRRVDTAGRVITLAGDGTPGWRDGPGRTARFNGPIGVDVDETGRIIVADTYNDRIRAIGPDLTVTTLAGGDGPGFGDGPAALATFDTPTDVAVEPDGAVVVVDSGNHVLRRIAPDGRVSTVTTAGTPLFEPLGVAAARDGRLLVTDRGRRVVEISPEYGAQVLAGGVRGFRNGLGEEARFRNPAGVAVAPDGHVIVADAGNRMIRRLDTPARLAAAPPAPPRVDPDFDFAALARLPLLWPLGPQDGPHEVAGTMGEARGNAGGEGRERFHAGLDIRAQHGAPVLAVRDGKISAPDATGVFGGLSEFLSIGPITYVHLRVGRDRRDRPIVPDRVWFVTGHNDRPARARVRRGTWFRTGEIVGTVNRFNHVHLNIGPRGEEANALRLSLPGFMDTVPPTIRGGITLLGEDGRPFERRLNGRVVVSGPVHVIVDAYDQVDGNLARRRLGVYRLGYQLLGADLSVLDSFPAPRETLVFDELPSSPDAPLSVFAPGSGIPFYGARRTRFLYRVTTRVEDGRVLDAPWDSNAFAPGDYVLRVLVADSEGNEAIAGRDVPITIVPPLPSLTHTRSLTAGS